MPGGAFYGFVLLQVPGEHHSELGQLIECYVLAGEDSASRAVTESARKDHSEICPRTERKDYILYRKGL